MLTLHEYERQFFPHRLALHHLLCYHIDLCGNSQKGYLGFYAHPFMTCHFCGCQAWTQAHRRWMLPLVVLARPLSGKLLCSTPGDTRIKGKSNQGFNGEDLDINGMPSGLPLVHLHHTWVVERGGLGVRHLHQ